MSVSRPTRRPRRDSGRPGTGNADRVSWSRWRSYRKPCAAPPAAAPMAAPPRYLRTSRRESTAIQFYPTGGRRRTPCGVGRSRRRYSTNAMDLIAELEWRELLYDASEGVRQVLAAGPVTGYIGFDPTAGGLPRLEEDTTPL